MKRGLMNDRSFIFACEFFYFCFLFAGVGVLLHSLDKKGAEERYNL
jgi:hypothetical protein